MGIESMPGAHTALTESYESNEAPGIPQWKADTLRIADEVKHEEEANFRAHMEGGENPIRALEYARAKYNEAKAASIAAGPESSEQLKRLGIMEKTALERLMECERAANDNRAYGGAAAA